MSWSQITQFWRRISKAKAFAEGQRINMSNYSQVPFRNDYNKLSQMFMLRLYHSNNTPFQLQSEKYTNQLANLHKEINFLNARMMMTRILLVGTLLAVYNFIIKQEEAKDWGDRFDLKFTMKAYGELEDSSGQGNTAIDD